MEDRWIEVGPRQNFSAAPTKITVTGKPVVLWDSNGTLFAVNGRCPHAGASMEHCEIEGALMTCPLHGWRFDLANDGIESHGYRPLTVYEVKEVGGYVYVNCSPDTRSTMI